MSMQSSGQLLLRFPLDPVMTLAAFVPGPRNQTALDAVLTLDKMSATSLVLWGEAGVGKSHLLHGTVLQEKRVAVYLDLAELRQRLPAATEEALTDFLRPLEACQLIAVDNLELWLDEPVLQEGLLYLFNRLRSTGGHLLVAGRESPAHMTALRDDLRTRLMWGPVLEVGPPDEEALVAVLFKLAEDRQVRISDELVRFLVLRLPRRVPDYVLALERLDRVALEQGRAMTVPFAKEVLGL